VLVAQGQLAQARGELVHARGRAHGGGGHPSESRPRHPGGGYSRA
jgi:hypothetical protein